MATCKPSPGAATETKSEATALTTFNGSARASAGAKRNAKLRTEITGSAQRSAQKFYFDISQTHTHTLRAHTIAFTANAKQQNKVAESKSQSRSQSLSQALFTLTAAGHSKCIWKGESPKLSPVCVYVCDCVCVSAVICSLFSYIKWLHAQLNTLHRGRWRVQRDTEWKRRKRSGCEVVQGKGRGIGRKGEEYREPLRLPLSIHISLAFCCVVFSFERQPPFLYFPFSPSTPSTNAPHRKININTLTHTCTHTTTTTTQGCQEKAVKAQFPFWGCATLMFFSRTLHSSWGSSNSSGERRGWWRGVLRVRLRAGSSFERWRGGTNSILDK